jgi:class 3 adenylate cyclase
MWRNAVVFTASVGGKCGIYLQEFAEARGRLILFFDGKASPETRFHFEKFVLTHIERHSLDKTVELTRFFVCQNCGDPVPENYVKRLKDKGEIVFNCPCEGVVLLAEPKEWINFPDKVGYMNKFANGQRDLEKFFISSTAETNTRGFQEWAGSELMMLAIVFTDIVDSTKLGEEIKDTSMNEVRRAHFSQSRKLIEIFKGKEIKTIGDSFMVAFKSADLALDYAIELQRDTGHPQVRIRAGIHIGSIYVEEKDVFGGTVNFAARVVGIIKGAEIWLSDRAKEDIDQIGAIKHKHLRWERHEGVEMKGFSGMFTLWSVQ